MTAVLAFTDGYELTQRHFSTYVEAYNTMESEYNDRYSDELDQDKESYIGNNSAKAVQTGIDIFLWNISITY